MKFTEKIINLGQVLTLGPSRDSMYGIDTQYLFKIPLEKLPKGKLLGTSGIKKTTNFLVFSNFSLGEHQFISINGETFCFDIERDTDGYISNNSNVILRNFSMNAKGEVLPINGDRDWKEL